MNELSGCWGDGSAFLLGMTCKERRKKKLESSGTGYGGGGALSLHGMELWSLWRQRKPGKIKIKTLSQGCLKEAEVSG